MKGTQLITATAERLGTLVRSMATDSYNLPACGPDELCIGLHYEINRSDRLSDYWNKERVSYTGKLVDLCERFLATYPSHHGLTMALEAAKCCHARATLLNAAR